jgi:hypothetical protein
MTREEDYRRNAAETLELASRVASSRDKGHLLSLAEKWLDLAGRIHVAARNRIGKAHHIHPLIRAKIPDREHDGP